MGHFVVATKTSRGMKVWLTSAGRWTPDIHGAKRFAFGVDSFTTSGKVWIEFAPVVK